MDFEIGKMVEDAMEDALRKLGRVNIVIAGRSGVGKSTLVNAVFQGRLAETGQGRPVTSSTREYRKEGVPVGLFDTRGLELERYADTLAELEQLIGQRASSSDPNEHLHLAWVCLSEDSRRVEDGERRALSMLASRMPTVAVITKARSDNGFRATVQELLPAAKNVIRVRAISEVDDDGHRIEARGLRELVDLSAELVPEGQRNAFAAAQRVDIDLKRKRAHGVVALSATAAGGIGAAPIPFSDAIAIVPIQIAMLASVSAVFGLHLSKAFLGTLVSSSFSAVAGTLAGRAIVGGLLKLIPGANILGMTISGATAALATTAFGEAYIGVLSALTSQAEDEPSPEQITEAFVKALTTRPS